MRGTRHADGRGPDRARRPPPERLSREARLAALREAIANDRYRVEPRALARAILRRWIEILRA